MDPEITAEVASLSQQLDQLPSVPSVQRASDSDWSDINTDDEELFIDLGADDDFNSTASKKGGTPAAAEKRDAREVSPLKTATVKTKRLE